MDPDDSVRRLSQICSRSPIIKVSPSLECEVTNESDPGAHGPSPMNTESGRGMAAVPTSRAREELRKEVKACTWLLFLTFQKNSFRFVRRFDMAELLT